VPLAQVASAAALVDVVVDRVGVGVEIGSVAAYQVLLMFPIHMVLPLTNSDFGRAASLALSRIRLNSLYTAGPGPARYRCVVL